MGCIFDREARRVAELQQTYETQAIKLAALEERIRKTQTRIVQIYKDGDTDKARSEYESIAPLLQKRDHLAGLQRTARSALDQHDLAAQVVDSGRVIALAAKTQASANNVADVAAVSMAASEMWKAHSESADSKAEFTASLETLNQQLNQANASQVDSGFESFIQKQEEAERRRTAKAEFVDSDNLVQLMSNVLPNAASVVLKSAAANAKTQEREGLLTQTGSGRSDDTTKRSLVIEESL